MSCICIFYYFTPPSSDISRGGSESTFKRHGYYCRSLRTGSITRPRSCVSCARAKARCDNERPECLRCISKAIKCRYPASKPQGTGTRTLHRNDALVRQRNPTSLSAAESANIGNHQEAGKDSDTILDTALDTSNLKSTDLASEHLDPKLELSNSLDTSIYGKTAQDSLLRLPSLAHQSTDASIPRLSTSTVRSFIWRPEIRNGAQRTANLILHTLKAYPLMLLRHNSLPPFIHPCLISSNDENNDMEPLTNCLSLVHTISSQIQGSRMLFWKGVRRECERLCAEVRRACDVLRKIFASS